ncbi:MAG: arginine kinase [Fusobacteriia bacterium 4572_132]|nr:MAG: arginine kinase [Fusobacteriia bacterium 4572_132]
MNGFPEFSKESKSLLKRCLTKEIYDKLKDLKTSNGFTLEQAIKSGVENQDSSIGVYAGDRETYSLFSPLFDKIILEYHKVDKNKKHIQNLNVKDLEISESGIDNERIISTRIRVGRNVKDFPLGTIISKKDREKIEKRVSNVLKNLDGEYKGSYYSLNNLTSKERKKLVGNHFLFKEGDRFLKSAGLNRDWPNNRGIFHNKNKTFLVWINEEDQLRIISMQKGGNVKEVFYRLVRALEILEEKIEFSFDEHLGYITSCPSNLGTAMRASVHIRLNYLKDNKEEFQKIAQKYNVQIRGFYGEHSKSDEKIYDISNKRRLGITEVEGVQDMYNGVIAMIKKDEELGIEIEFNQKRG